jgi:hypothetical protein
VAEHLRPLEEGALTNEAVELARIDESVVPAVGLPRTRGPRGARNRQGQVRNQLQETPDDGSLPDAGGAGDDEQPA